MTQDSWIFSLPSNPKVAKNLCFGFNISLFIMAFLCDSPEQILADFITYFKSPSVLITDYFVIGSIGGAFFNSALVVSISLFLLKIAKAAYSGSIAAAIYLVAGFALFGKDPFNIIPFFIGTAVYCKVKKQPLSRHVITALFSSTLAPFVSEVLIETPLHIVFRLPLSILAGAFIGYIIIPIAQYAFSFHKGFILFNTGFAGGLVALVLSALFTSMGHDIATEHIWYYGVDPRVLAYLVLLCFALILCGLKLCDWKVRPYFRIFRHTGRYPTDFFLTDGAGIATMNMGIVGLICIAYILLIGGDLSGPVVGAILSSIGFGAAGEHPKNNIPVMFGIFISSYIMTQHDPTTPSMQLAALFGTALAPISGQFGWPFGIIAGILHSAVVMVTSGICGGYNLYNNGFAAGFVALIMIALIQGLSNKWVDLD